MLRKDATFQKWDISGTDGDMYDIDSITRQPEGVVVTLHPDGPNRKHRAPHTVRLVWENLLACHVTDETYREDCWIRDSDGIGSFYVSRDSAYLAEFRRSPLFPADAIHFLIVGTNTVADVLATDYPITYIDAT